MARTPAIFRVHQFDKVEMFSLTTPERSWDEHEALLAIEEYPLISAPRHPVPGRQRVQR